MKASCMSAVVVTRGGRDMSMVKDILKSFGEVSIWDNSKQPVDRKVYGRYLAIKRAEFPFVFTMDDDCVVDAVAIAAEYTPGHVVCNMKLGHHLAYSGTGIALVGHGAVFHRSYVDFSPYLDRYPEDALFDRECDRVFTWLNRDRLRLVDLGVGDLPHATQPGCMWMEPRHGDDLAEIRHRLATIETICLPT